MLLECGLDSFGPEYGPAEDYFKHNNGYSCSIKEKFLDQLSDCQLLQKGCAVCS
jgi:hypothetical protein